ncbi:ATP-binding protein [Streptomyces boninensis]|uniref:ATP-binding protein n=1 Tax=Streptomyces boninensis TaxID=2039455 RepID=UPI003B2140F4
MRPHRHCTVELEAAPARIGQARRIVSAQLRYWHLDHLVDRAALALTELLTNVHRHAEPDKHCTVELELRPGELLVSVRDGDPRLPEMQPPELLSGCGRGLPLVAAVSESWGCRVREGGAGKSVWFSLAAPPIPPPPTPPPHAYGNGSVARDDARPPRLRGQTGAAGG